MWWRGPRVGLTILWSLVPLADFPASGSTHRRLAPPCGLNGTVPPRAAAFWYLEDGRELLEVSLRKAWKWLSKKNHSKTLGPRWESTPVLNLMTHSKASAGKNRDDLACTAETRRGPQQNRLCLRACLQGNEMLQPLKEEEPLGHSCWGGI